MKLIVGLGNPGEKYANHRHNIGFMAIDRIAEDHNAGPWRRKFQGEVTELTLSGQKAILLKPQTFMNLSGQSVGEAARFYKIPTADIVVLHDELDLAPGKVRVKTGGGHAGHNGLRSLHQHVGPDYVRVRLGIGHPGDKRFVSNHVLGNFAKADSDWLSDLLSGISDGAADLLAGANDKFMNKVAQKTVVQRSKPETQRAAPKSAPTPSKEEAPDTRSALQRLMDKFS